MLSLRQILKYKMLTSWTAPSSALPLDKHHPTFLELTPAVQVLEDVAVPDMLQTLAQYAKSKPLLEDEEEDYDLLEWCDLASLGSKQALRENSEGLRLGASATPTTLRALKLQGLVSPEWITSMLIDIM